MFLVVAYPMADGSGNLHVATTRPETLLGDTAVRVKLLKTANSAQLEASPDPLLRAAALPTQAHDERTAQHTQALEVVSA